MAASGGSSSALSLPPPRPKSPPEYPDLYGKRRELAKVLMLEREISFLQDEMKYVEGLQPASPSCKEVAEFIAGNSDPFIPVIHKVSQSHCFWKWLCGSGKSNSKKSWNCCTRSQPTATTTKSSSCCNCNLCLCSYKGPTCRCFSWPSWRCFSKIWCNCCTFQCNSCSNSGCCKWRCCSCPKCPKVKKCQCCCTGNCCYTSCL